MTKNKHTLYQFPGGTICHDGNPNRVQYCFSDESFQCSERAWQKNLAHWPEGIAGKGAITNQLSALFFSLLHQWNMPNHFFKCKDMKTSIMHASDALPFSLRLRAQADPLMKKMLILDGEDHFSPLLVEYIPMSYSPFQMQKSVSSPSSKTRFLPKFSKKSKTSDSCSDDMMMSPSSYHLNEDFIVAMGWLEQDEVEDITLMAIRATHALQGFLAALNLKLFYIDYAFGRLPNGDWGITGFFSPETLCVGKLLGPLVSVYGGHYVEKDPQEHYNFFTRNILTPTRHLRHLAPESYEIPCQSDEHHEADWLGHLLNFFWDSSSKDSKKEGALEKNYDSKDLHLESSSEVSSRIISIGSLKIANQIVKDKDS